jgi:hypothetical protein
MPVLRYRDKSGEPIEVLLSHAPGGAGIPCPVTLGWQEDGAACVPLPEDAGASVRARVVTAFIAGTAYVLAAREFDVDDRPGAPIRVLRHGDRLRLGGLEVLYLDFSPQRLATGSPLIGRRCSRKECAVAQEEELWEGDRVVTCPRCGAVYHRNCWLMLEKCATESCPEHRHLLLAELAAHVRVDRYPGSTGDRKVRCANYPACPTGDPLALGEPIIRCRSRRCGHVYHPGCWFGRRGVCEGCQDPIESLVDQVLFRMEARPQ